MYTVGQIQHIHLNGRINYQGQALTEADGREIGAEQAYQAAKQLERATKTFFAASSTLVGR